MTKGIRNLAFLVAACGAGAINLEANHRYKIELACQAESSDVVAYVVDWLDTGLALYVFDGQSYVVSEWAEQRTIESASQTRVAYSAGSVLEGGADLRVITEHARFPALRGKGHLTVRLDGRASNLAVKCQ